MKVLHLLGGMYYGGTEMHVLTNCVAATFARHAIYSLSPAPGDNNDFSEHFLSAGLPMYYRNLESVSQEFDVVHVYGLREREDEFTCVRQRPFVWTMTFNTVAPPVGAPILCTSFQTLLKQDSRNDCYLYRCAVDMGKFDFKKKVEHEGLNLIRVCRPTKSEMVLDEVIAEILNDYPFCSYYVIGDTSGVNHQRIHYLGRVKDIIPYLRKADIFVYAPKIPSGCTCDICVIEAMAMGLPVVATRAWQVTEQISHGETGIFVDYDKDSMRRAIEYLIRYPEERPRMGTNGVARVQRLFDIDLRMPLLKSLYEGVRDNKNMV